MNRRLYGVGVVVGLVVVAGVVVLSLAQGSDDDDSAASPQRPETRGYCDGAAEEVGLGGAAHAAPFTLLIPDHPLANLTNLDRALVCPNAVAQGGRSLAAVRLEFSSGVVLMQEWNELRDPEETFRSMAAEQDGITLTTVHGQPAGVGEISEERGAKGAVQWVEGHRNVIVQGNGAIDPAELLEVAESTRAA